MVKNKLKRWSEFETARIIREIDGCKTKSDEKWIYSILAEEFGVTPNAVYNKYHTSTQVKKVPGKMDGKHMELHSGSIMTHHVVNTGTKKTSRFWSKAELKKLMEIIASHPDTKKGKGRGFKEAMKYFGVTKKAIYARYSHCKNNTGNSRINRNTTKVVVTNKRGKRGKYKLRTITKLVNRGPGKVVPMSVMVKTPELRSLTFDIQDVKVDLESKKLTILF